ncbi:thioredoxin family protein [Thalassococcus sp. CAU 1522]|uniref:Thioredoxin family protein n=1 Tax=Thalassococcus arenae TaxID=2851652 RepID=A0ABS6NB21_9RHOB|nr:thioredoxin family protein [Thalassococcus arenae]MBV2361225.1 thioredoxin family protein [Thalassococcus arenae]
MAAVTPPVCEFDLPAPDFALPGTDGKTYRLVDFAGPNGTLVMFICNHCPYVLAVLDKIIRDAHDLQALGIGVAAICSNDAKAYPADGFDKMVEMAREHALPFPYLHDAEQNVARAYGAACTPDFFGYNANLGLQYRGRLDASGMRTGADDLPRELFEAMKQVAETGRGPADQTPSIGCSIKWKAA